MQTIKRVRSDRGIGTSSAERGVSRARRVGLGACLGLAGVFAASPAMAGDPSSAGLFNWEGALGGIPGVTPVHWLSDSNYEALTAELASLPVGSRAVKVRETLTVGASIFDSLEIPVVFADYEGAGSLAATSALVAQVGGSAMSSGALVGNYNYDPFEQADPGYTGGDPVSGADFLSSGVSMSNSNLYPGSPTQSHTNGPNTLSALFINPIIRMTGAEAEINSTFPGMPNIPYVARFNSNGNTALNTSDGGVDPEAFETTDQLLSRGDFKALVAHYRMRGAESAILFEPGVVGYDKTTQMTDAAVGWSDVDAAFTAGAGVPEAGSADVGEGTVVSAVRNDALDTLTLLISNMSDSTKLVPKPTMGGMAKTLVDDDSLRVRPGKHLLLTFALDGEGVYELVDRDSRTFADGIRSGIGVPEPASFGVLATIGLILTFSRSTTDRRES